MVNSGNEMWQRVFFAFDWNNSSPFQDLTILFCYVIVPACGIMFGFCGMNNSIESWWFLDREKLETWFSFIFLYVFCFKWCKWTLTWNNSSPLQDTTLSFWYQIALLNMISFGSGGMFNYEMANASWKKHERENWQLSENEIWQRQNSDFSFRME